MPKSRVLLADDNSAVLQLVSQLLENHFEMVGALHDGAAVLRDWPGLCPDVIVLDVAMGEPNGIDVAHRLRHSGCHASIVFLTVYDDPEFVSAAMAAGASGYVTKSRARMDLLPAIRAVLAGNTFTSPNISGARE